MPSPPSLTPTPPPGEEEQRGTAAPEAVLWDQWYLSDSRKERLTFLTLLGLQLAMHQSALTNTRLTRSLVRRTKFRPPAGLGASYYLSGR